MEDKGPQDNTKAAIRVSADHIVECQGEKFGKRLELTSDPSAGVDEFLQNNQHRDESNVFESGEKQEVEDTTMEGAPLEENPVSSNCIIELTEEQAMSTSIVTGMKRKAETSETANEEAAPATPKVEELMKKWYCSLCEVSTTSEGTLNHHMQGKKHKAEEAKSKSNNTNNTISITGMDCDVSDNNSLQPVLTANSASLEGEEQSVANKWHCSLCQVSTTSGAVFKSHLQGKKHKAKEAKLGLFQKTGDTDGPENVKTEAMTKYYCSLCEVYAPSERNLQDHLQGKKHKAKEGDQNPPENEPETAGNTLPEKGETCRNEREVKESSLENSGNGGDECQEMIGETGKYWHCKMCNEGTQDEANMDAHRRSNKHREALRENGGGVIVVSRIMVKQ